MAKHPEIGEALIEAEKRGELIGFLGSEVRRMRKHEWGRELSELHNSGLIALVSNINLREIAALEGNSFWSMVDSLDQAIPNLVCSHQEVLNFVGTLIDKAGADRWANTPNLSLVKWSSNNPKQAQQIVEGARALDPICLAHCAYAALGLGEEKIAFELLEHSNDAVVANGLRVLGRLDLQNLTSQKKAVDSCYKALKCETGMDLRLAAIEAAFRIWKNIGQSNPYLQIELLGSVISAAKEVEIIQLSAMLFYHHRGLVAESIDLILAALKTEVSEPAAILTNLDNALFQKDGRWSTEKVNEVFAAQLPRFSVPVEASQFSNFCSCILDDPKKASQLFSNWLLAGEKALCTFLADIVGPEGKKRALVQISKSDLPTDVNEQIFVARKCIGFFWFHEITAASILLSIVKNGKLQARQAVEELIYDPLLLSYSGELRTFLEAESKSRSKRVSECVQRLLVRHDEYLSGIRQASHLVELFPTIEQRRAAAMKDNERNADIQRQAYKRSIFASVISHETLLYGRQSFTLIEGAGGEKIPSVLPLTEISHSTEIPRLTIVHPSGFHWTLTLFMNETQVKN